MEIIDLEMMRGDDDGFTFEVFDVVELNNGTHEETEADFTDCRLDLHIKPSKGEIIKLSSTTGEITVRGNVVDVTVSHDKTHDVKWKEAQWDMQRINSEGKVRTFVGGTFELAHDITDIGG